MRFLSYCRFTTILLLVVGNWVSLSNSLVASIFACCCKKFLRLCQIFPDQKVWAGVTLACTSKALMAYSSKLCNYRRWLVNQLQHFETANLGIWMSKKIRSGLCSEWLSCLRNHPPPRLPPLIEWNFSYTPSLNFLPKFIVNYYYFGHVIEFSFKYFGSIIHFFVHYSLAWAYNLCRYPHNGFKTSSPLSVVNKSFRTSSKYNLRLIDDNQILCLLPE